MPKKPEYLSIADTLRAEVLAGDYDAAPLPGNGEVAERFDVNMKTAGRAVQQLVAEGLVIARPGLRAVPTPPELRGTRWPMNGRYARARAARGLVFAGDVSGNVRKDTVSREWAPAPLQIAHLLGVKEGARVMRRNSRTFIDDVATEDTILFFPEAIAAAAPELETADRIQVVALIEDAGHTVTRTANEIRARHATTSEQELFGIDANNIVIEHIHGTYGATGEPLEAVINVRPAQGGVITFDTYEAPLDNE
ncbi:UTRA domain-containing protein [Nocardia salmonicida]|uniref:UTRA domain-containing protein n=1 Tax=Nocardia salmonicida TaxID=53431 RepID=UPI0007A493E7|nr:GntR family transcriptional regulator [Nocardia salmonicida]MBC7299455.1 GntR family transcriptional regulator [Nocardia sp.]